MDKKYIDNAKRIINEKLNKEGVLKTEIRNVVVSKDDVKFKLYIKIKEMSFEESLIMPLDYMKDDETIVRGCVEVLDSIILSLLSKCVMVSSDIRRLNINQILILQDILDEINVWFIMFCPKYYTIYVTIKIFDFYFYSVYYI